MNFFKKVVVSVVGGGDGGVTVGFVVVVLPLVLV